MAPRNDGTTKKAVNKGAWTAEEDRNVRKLSQCIELHGAGRWKTLATKSGLNRCGKSCRLRWLNYLRPNIKRGNISAEEEDLILRLHKLLGNRWSLIAGRLPGRTDNEIKNYWNSHLSKKIKEKENKEQSSPAQESPSPPPPLMKSVQTNGNERNSKTEADLEFDFDVTELLDFTAGGSYGLEWVNRFLELDEDTWMNDKR